MSCKKSPIIMHKENGKECERTFPVVNTRVLLIDNYDSFTYNVYQYMSELGADVTVVRNDEVTLEYCENFNADRIVISPGPGYPSSAGISKEVIAAFAGKVPIFGVCLGHQAMIEVFGGKIVKAGEIVHGKTSPVTHDGKGVFADVPQDVAVTRYHSLVGEVSTLPDALEVTSTLSGSDMIMGVRLKAHPNVEGVQFHPESIVSEHGKRMIYNFLQMV